MPLINFHTHRPAGSPNELSIRSVSPEEAVLGVPSGIFTVGIHPWDATRIEVQEWIEAMDGLAASTRVAGVGEVGLDRLRGCELTIQEEILRRQICVAERHRKPVVIHCVRAWDRLMRLRGELNPTTPWSVHGFMGSRELAKQLVDSGFYLSFGSILLNPVSKTIESIRAVPLDRLFLETDNSDASILNIYQAASRILMVELENLQAQILDNYRRFFPQPSKA